MADQKAASSPPPSSSTPNDSIKGAENDKKISSTPPISSFTGVGAATEDEEDPLVIDEAATTTTTTSSSSNNINNSTKEDEDEEEEEEANEKEFEPSVEMMINDFDDERTMEEEEAMDNQDDEGAELTALEQEQDIPIEDLLKMYGYDRNNADVSEGDKEGGENDEGDDGDGDEGDEEDEEDDDEEEEEETEEPDEEEDDEREKDETKTKMDTENNPDKNNPFLTTEVSTTEAANNEECDSKKRSSSTPPPPAKKSKSELARFYESTIEGRSLRSTTGQTGLGEEDEESDGNGEGADSDLEGRDYSWKKTIMIGPSFQANVPTGMCQYGDSLPYENDDKQLWDPKLLSPDEVEDYLAKSQDTLPSNGSASGGVGSLPIGAHIRDDEQALFLLLQCGYNYEEALRRRRMNAVPPADTMSLWSEDECRAFELGLRLYGKDFTMIQQQKVRTRSVGELVQFYYLWKKTERHDVFANSNRLEKKKYTLHPGTTDYMDRFIDEQDQSRDRSSSPNYHSLLHGTSGNSSQKSSNGDLAITPSTTLTTTTSTTMTTAVPASSSTPLSNVTATANLP